MQQATTNGTQFETPAEINVETLVHDDKIHASLYTDPHIFEQELEKIFYRVWVFVGHDSEVPEPGDYVTRQIGRQPVLMVRDKAGAVSVFLNRCAHRGTLVCPAESGNARAFTCPYHGWTYDLSGQLTGVPFPGAYGPDFNKGDHHLPRAARCDSYRGFVFASLNPEGPSLADHLGIASRLIDRACDLSPEGELDLSAGWVKHRYMSNWKMIPENDTDGYHLGFVHRSVLRSAGSQYQLFIGEESGNKGLLRDWGNGHTEIEFSSGYKQPFEWFGGAPDKYAAYLAQLEHSCGKAEADRRVFEGPPHALIFPNLFLAEMNIALFYPLDAEESIQWHTPMFLKGVPELNTRLLRQSEAAMGPASFLLPEDITIASRNQAGLHARQPEWIDLSRGRNREYVDEAGRVVSHFTDEVTNRAFWKHYRTLMAQA